MTRLVRSPWLLLSLLSLALLLRPSAQGQVVSTTAINRTTSSSTPSALNVCDPRIPITSLPREIGTPGSYYLVSDLALVLPPDTPPEDIFGIKITTGNVTIDLNGFTLNGSAYTCPAIQVHGGGEHVRVHSGSISGWLGGGIELSGSWNSQVRDVHIDTCAGIAIRIGNNALVMDAVIDGAIGGIEAGDNSIVRDCLVVRSAPADSIRVGNYSRVSGCIVNVDAGSRGIVTGVSSIVKDCTTSNNNAGITVDAGSGVFDCVTFNSGNSQAASISCFRSTIARCTVRQSTVMLDADQSLVFQCGFFGNGGEQLVLRGHNTFTGNNLVNCGVSLLGNENNLRDNQVSGYVNHTLALNSSEGNVVVQNFVGDQTTVLQDGNDHIGSFLVNPGPMFSTDQPWANFRVGP